METERLGPSGKYEREQPSKTPTVSSLSRRRERESPLFFPSAGPSDSFYSTCLNLFGRPSHSVGEGLPLRSD